MTHLLGTGCLSQHHWECGAGGASAERHFPAHFSDRERERKRNSEHPSTVSQPLWKTSRFFPPLGILALLHNPPAAK